MIMIWGKEVTSGASASRGFSPRSALWLRFKVQRSRFTVQGLIFGIRAGFYVSCFGIGGTPVASISSIPSGALQDSGFKIRAGFRIEDSRFGVWDSGIQGSGSQDSALGIQDSGFGIWDTGFGIQGCGDPGIRKFGIWDSEIRVSGYRISVSGFRNAGFGIRDS